MQISVNMKITHNRLPEIIGKFPGLASAVIRKTAFDIEADAKEFVPVKSGTLQNSISTEVDEFYATIAPHTDYAAYVEFGTYKMAAKSYMVPAADRNAPKFEAAMEEILGNL